MRSFDFFNLTNHNFKIKSIKKKENRVTHILGPIHLYIRLLKFAKGANLKPNAIYPYTCELMFTFKSLQTKVNFDANFKKKSPFNILKS